MNKVTDIEGKIGQITDNLKNKRNEIPHVKNKKREEENKKLKEENKQLLRQIKSLQDDLGKKEHKIAKQKKNDQKDKEQINKLKEDKEKAKENEKIWENRYYKKEKSEQYHKSYIDKIENEKDTIEKEVERYKDTIQNQKEQGEYVPDLHLEIDTIKDELETNKQRYEREIVNLKERNKEYRKHITGNKKSVQKEKRKNDELRKELGHHSEKLGYVKQERNGLKKKLKEERSTVSDLRKQIYENKEDIVGRLNGLIEDLNINTIEQFSLLEGLYEEYLEVFQYAEEERNKRDDIYGYIHIENENAYVIDIDKKDSYKITDFKGLSVKDDMVCRITYYMDGRVILEDTFDTDKKYEDDKNRRRRQKKIRNTLKVKYDYPINDLNIIFLTEKKLNMYRKYFGEKVTIVQPFEDGEKKVLQEVDKADIVMMRMDAVPHTVSNYVKKEKKDKVVFLDNGNLADTGLKLTGKIKDLIE